MTTVGQLYRIFCEHRLISTDSRKVQPDSMFFALRGERFDGNVFARQALEHGAVCAVVDQPICEDDPRCFRVDNVLHALQDLARHHRRQFDIPVLAITGSNGKTTTKELVSAVLSSHFPTHATNGNLNNHIGVPLTLLSMPNNTRIAVVEMGANHIGEISLLCDIAKPTHGLITNIGLAHLEGFDGLEGVKKGKSELYRYLETHNGIAFVNGSEPYLKELISPRQQVVWYRRATPDGVERDALEVELLAAHPCVKVGFTADDGAWRNVASQLLGEHNFHNIMTAIAVSLYFRVPAEKIAAAIAAYQPKDMRSQWVTYRGIPVLLDAYNANPSSMRKSLELFADHQADRKMVVLGAMKELGVYAADAHSDTARLAAEMGFDRIVLVGEEFRQAATAIGVEFFEDTQALRQWFAQQDCSGYSILVKGSRSVGLEKLFH